MCVKCGKLINCEYKGLKMDKYQSYAVGHYTCDHPEGASFEEVLALIRADAIEVTIWEPFEDYDGEYIAERIENMADTLEYHFK